VSGINYSIDLVLLMSLFHLFSHYLISFVILPYICYFLHPFFLFQFIIKSEPAFSIHPLVTRARLLNFEPLLQKIRPHDFWDLGE